MIMNRFKWVVMAFYLNFWLFIEMLQLEGQEAFEF